MIVRSIHICISLLLLAWLALACAAASPPAVPATETPGAVSALSIPASSPEAVPERTRQAPGGLAVQSNPSPSPSPQPIDLGIWQTYRDDTSRFTLSYPSVMTIKALTTDELSQLKPRPVAAVDFQDLLHPSADNAPPAFSMRQFANPKQQELQDWLVGSGLLQRAAGRSSEPYRGKDISGLKVLQSTFMAPGWFIYVGHHNYVYQLTALGAAGEQMLDSFRFID